MVPSPRLLTMFSKREIKNLFSNARAVFKSACITILKSPCIDYDFSRILVITPRKVGNAPERNKLKRRVKDIFYTKKMYEGKFNYIFLARKGAKEKSYKELKKIFDRICPQ